MSLATRATEPKLANEKIKDPRPKEKQVLLPDISTSLEHVKVWSPLECYDSDSFPHSLNKQVDMTFQPVRGPFQVSWNIQLVPGARFEMNGAICTHRQGLAQGL